MISVTVFTPVYNRAYIINKLYDSLCKQTIKDFEWIVINDGSTDNIDIVVNEWIGRDNEFEIKYLTVMNQGKHCAINKGVEMAKGKLFFIVDSDDFLVENAIELILEKEKEIPGQNFAGLSFNRGYSKEKIIGTTFSGDFVDATSLERRKYNIMGDKAEVFYTDLLKQYPFPKFEGENYLTEAVVWYKIANDGYKIRWFNQIIYICNYLPDGLSANNSLDIKNFKGYTYATKELLSYRLPFIDKLKIIGNYMYAAKRNNLTYSQASKKTNSSRAMLFISYKLYLLKKFFQEKVGYK